MLDLETLFNTLFSFHGIGLPLIASLIASVITFFMYQIFYGSKNIGAGVHRSFLIGGPAITMIFLVIQTSIPLGLGLLGALSFVRFRTPVKDPAEIGFLLLLIASALGTATRNYVITAVLFVIVFIALGVQWLLSNRVSLFGRGHLMISVDQSSFPTLEKSLRGFLNQHLKGLSLETMSTMDGHVGLHYQYRRQPNFNWTVFTNELNQIAGPAKVEIFIS
jgi:hypothetical protein